MRENDDRDVATGHKCDRCRARDAELPRRHRYPPRGHRLRWPGDEDATRAPPRGRVLEVGRPQEGTRASLAVHRFPAPGSLREDLGEILDIVVVADRFRYE